MPVGALAGLLKSPMGLIFIILLIGLILTPIGLLLIGVTIISGTIIALLIGLFIPAILVVVAFLVLFGVIPGLKVPWNLITGVALLVFAYVMWAGWLV
jgi:hypothetical protein